MWGWHGIGPLETRFKLFAVDFLIKDIVTFINGHRIWTHTAIAAIYFAMVREWGYWEVRRTLAETRIDGDIFGER